MPSQKLEVPKTQTVTSGELTLEACLQQIYASYQNGQWAQAIAQCESVIAHCNQRMAEATEITPEEQSAGSPNVELWIVKGDLLNRQNKTAEAINLYEQALLLNPQQPELFQKISSLYAQQAQAAKAKEGVSSAVRVYLQALQKHPRLFKAYTRLRYNLMRYEIAAGDPVLEEIVQVCQRIITKDSTILPAQVTLGFALTKLNKPEEATACFRHVSEQFTRRQLEKVSVDADRETSISFLKQPRTPDFMIIGAEKCGTTSLYQYLCQHPDVLPPIEKEIDFFDMEYEQGLDWYLAHFPPRLAPHASTHKQWITGETSPNYLYSDTAPKRIFQNFPNIKLAVILRNPIDRTVSRYNMMVRNGAEKRTFERAVTEELTIIQKAMSQSKDGQSVPWPVLNRCRHIGNSLYCYHLARWLELFSAEQFLVLRSEDLFTQPEQTLSQLYQSFGLESHLKQDYPKHNSGQYSPIEGEIRQTLSTFFTPHTRKLEVLLGRSFDWEL